MSNRLTTHVWYMLLAFTIDAQDIAGFEEQE
jgi:hypothetical protein